MNTGTRGSFIAGATRKRARSWLVVAQTVALAGIVAGSLAVPGEASADSGALTQLPGVEGCISDDGSSACSDARVLNSPLAMHVGPDGRQVYVGLPSDRGLAVLARDRATGALEQLPGRDGCITEFGNGGECTAGRGIRTVFDMAFSPDGRFAYAASQFSDAVAAFARNKQTGALKQLPGFDGCVSETGSEGCANGRGLLTTQSVAVSPDGKNLYAASGGSGAIAVFDRDKTTGALTQLPGLQGCISEDGTGGECTDGRGLKYAASVTVSPDGKHVYVASVSHAVAIFARDRATGALTQLPGAAGCLRDARIADLECAPVREVGYAASLLVSEDGRYAYVGGTGNAIAVFSRDRASGELTQLPGTLGCVTSTGNGDCTYASMLFTVIGTALSPNGRQLYVTGAAANAITILERDPATGVLSQLPGLQGCVGLWGNDGLCREGRGIKYPMRVDVSPDGRHVYAGSMQSKAVAVFQRER